MWMPSPARMVVVVFIFAPFQLLPSGSMSQPTPALIVVVVFILASVSAPAVGVDLAAGTGADRGRRLHPCLPGIELSRRDRCASRSRSAPLS
jgi:hypothetical protein